MPALQCLYDNNYQLSLMDPHDEKVLQPELDNHCDKLAVDS